MRTSLLLCVALIFLSSCALAGCATPKSTPPQDELPEGVELAGGEQPVKGALTTVELAGYCPVAYVEAGKAIRGVPRYPVEVEGEVYWFVDEGSQSAFVRNPGKYAVKYRGWDARALSRGELVSSDPQVFVVHEGAVYLFADGEGRAEFEQAPAEVAERAEQQWTLLGAP